MIQEVSTSVDMIDVTCSHIFCPDTRTVVKGVCSHCGMNDDGAVQWKAGATHYFVDGEEVERPRYEEAYRQMLTESGQEIPDWLRPTP